ncbi:putative manganese transporter [Streptomyces sp. NPDC006458]|uniref:putative manganese transporter n=1 Tax=Streptomyces sp. NPDC006458 TaxID=3154302 RepID=UPI00339F399B
MDVVLVPLADGFMQVGVFVAMLVGVFSVLRSRYGDRLVVALESRRKAGPLVGALLGVSPGCAGALMLTPLYTRRTVSFGTVIAGITATMGDSSWVIMAGEPVTALKVHILLFLTGLACGYAIDALHITPERLGSAVRARRREAARVPAAVGASVGVHAATVTVAAAGAVTGAGEGAGGTSVAAPVKSRPAADVLDPAPAKDVPDAPPKPVVRLLVPALWVIAALASLVAVPVAFQMVRAGTLTRLLGGVDPYVALGVLGTATCAALAFAERGKPHHRDVLAGRRTAQALREGAGECATIVVWVSLVYVLWSVIQTTTGFDGSQLPMQGLPGVLAGALVGLIPGCAVQIAFTSLYLSGVAPLPTLMANAVSQDGDALLPLISQDGRAAALTTVITTVPGLVVGSAMLLWM